MLSQESPGSTRRAYLATVTGGIATLAGCLGFGSDRPAPGNRTTSSGDPRSPGTTTATTTTPTTTTATPGQSTTTELHATYETTVVEVVRPDGTLLGSVTAAIADTGELRYTGLSETDSLPEDRGMLFVFDSVDQYTFVMRDMDFGLDIVFADADKTITRIHHAPAPDQSDDDEGGYPGRGQYVLEVNLDWTTDRNVTEGDRLDFRLPDT